MCGDCAPGRGCVCLQHGKTALLLASEHGHADIVRMLLERGASVDAIDCVSQPACLVAPQPSPSLHGAAVPRPHQLGGGVPS